MAVPTLYTYTLQTDNTPAGVVTVTLYSEFNGLTIPTFSSLYYNEINERYDAILNKVELAAMQCSFSEDYSTYLEGFWFKVLNGYAELRFSLEEDGTTNTHLFWGRCIQNLAPIEELAIVSGQFVRQGSFQVVSLLVKASEYLTHSYTDIGGDLETQMVFYPNWDGLGTDAWFLSVVDTLAVWMQTVFNGTFDSTDIIIPEDDFEFYGTVDTTWHSITEALVYYSIDVAGSPTGANWRVDVDKLYPTLFDFFVGYLKEFGLVPRHTYNVSTGRHQLQLLTRGRSFSPLTLTTPYKSSFTPAAYPTMSVLSKTRADFANSATEDVFYMSDGAGFAGQVPDNLTTDFNITCFFRLRAAENTGSSTYTEQRSIMLPDGGALQSGSTDFRFWNYTSGAFDSNTDTPVKPRTLEYFYNRFGFAKRAYVREYPSLRSDNGVTNSQENTHCLMATTINDGLTDRDYYAVEVTKRIQENTCSITWNEV